MELKACPNPWCVSTSRPIPAKSTHPDDAWRVICGCGVSTYRHDTVAEAIAAWNNRTPDPEILTLRARVAELEGDNRKALVAFTVIETLSPVWSMDVDENMERLKSVAREASATLSKAKEIVDHG